MDKKVRLVFACGAYIECHPEDAPTEGKIGKRVLVFVNDPKQKIQRPHIPEEAIEAENLPKDARACCLLACPCTVKESGRKTGRGWFGPQPDMDTTTDPVLFVNCVIRGHGHSPNAESEALT